MKSAIILVTRIRPTPVKGYMHPDQMRGGYGMGYDERGYSMRGGPMDHMGNGRKVVNVTRRVERSAFS